MAFLKRLEEWEIPSSASQNDDVLHFRFTGSRLPSLEELTRLCGAGRPDDRGRTIEATGLGFRRVLLNRLEYISQ